MGGECGHKWVRLHCSADSTEQMKGEVISGGS